MSVASEITRIQTAKADIKASIEAKGVTIPSDALINQYADYVDQIQTGGGGGNEDLIDLIEGDITTLNIPSGTSKIGNYALSNYTSLTSVTIPDSVTSIGDYAFMNCSGLTGIIIPNRVTSISAYVFQHCRGLTSVTIPDSVKRIGQNAFNNCTGLTSIIIPNRVTSIDMQAFSNCTGLTSVTIGSGVTSIGGSAFRYCSKLTSVTINATTPPTLANANAFNNTSTNLIIYVPAESVSAYKAATNWSSLASRIQAIPTE